MIYLLLIFQLFLIVEMRRRLRGFNPAEAASWFLLVSEILYINGDWVVGDDNGSWRTYSYINHPEVLVIYYTCVVLMFSASTVGLRRLSTSVAEVRQSMLAIIARVATVEPFLLGIILLFVGAYMMLIDWDILLDNSTYLLMGSKEAMKGNNAAGGFIQSVVGATAPISAMFVAISLTRRFTALTFGWIAVFSWQLAIAIGGASRSAAVILGIVVIFSSLFAKKAQPFRQAFLGLCAGWIYCAALSGRGLGHFGLTAIPSILAAPTQLDGGKWLEMLSSIFQGAFVTGDGLDYSADFNPIYKILSFSPFPSAVDNFSYYLPLYGINLNPFVPMGAQTEVIFFGPIYTALFWGTLFFLCRFLTKNKNKIGIFYYFGSLYFLVVFIQTGAYPTRNVYRSFVLLLIFTIVLANRNKKVATKAAKSARPALQDKP